MKGRKVKVIGVSGSPRKDGNSVILVKEALAGAAEVEDVETEFIGIGGMNIRVCQHCGYCTMNRGEKCKYPDGAMEILDKLTDEADGWILGFPTYNSNSGTILPLLSRVSYRIRRNVMSLTPGLPNTKPAACITVAASRHSGETAIQGINDLLLIREAIPIGMPTPFYDLGLTTIGWSPGQVREDKWYDPILKRDTSSLELARMYGKKLAIVTKIMVVGAAVTGLKYVDVGLGKNMPGGPYRTNYDVYYEQEMAKRRAKGGKK